MPPQGYSAVTTLRDQGRARKVRLSRSLSMRSKKGLDVAIKVRVETSIPE
jgi:hypothetical protein